MRLARPDADGACNEPQAMALVEAAELRGIQRCNRRDHGDGQVRLRTNGLIASYSFHGLYALGHDWARTSDAQLVDTVGWSCRPEDAPPVLTAW